MKCVWCNCNEAVETTKDCQWIDPNGSENITVSGVPAIHCPQCRDTYLDDDIYAEVESAIHTVDIGQLGNPLPYETLMKAPRLSIFELFQRGDRFNCH